MDVDDGTIALSPDDYERQYMDGDRALLRARQRTPRWGYGLLAAAFAVAFGVGASTLRLLWEHRDEPWAVTLLAAFAAWISVYTLVALLGGVASHVLRVALTPTHLHVHHGVVAQSVPLAAVTSVSAGRARARPSLVGSLTRRERVFTVAGGASTLRVNWRDARGRERTTWVQFDAAPAFARQIEALTGEGTGVRVTADAEDEAPVEARDAVTAAAKRGAA